MGNRHREFFLAVDHCPCLLEPTHAQNNATSTILFMTVMPKLERYRDIPSKQSFLQGQQRSGGASKHTQRDCPISGPPSRAGQGGQRASGRSGVPGKPLQSHPGNGMEGERGIVRAWQRRVYNGTRFDKGNPVSARGEGGNGEEFLR